MKIFHPMRWTKYSESFAYCMEAGEFTGGTRKIILDSRMIAIKSANNIWTVKKERINRWKC